MLGLLPLTLYLYLPIVAAGDPVLAYGVTPDWSSFWGHVTGSRFHALVHLPGTAEQTLLNTLARWLRGMYGIYSVFLVVALAGIGFQLGRRRRLAAIALAYVPAVIFGMSYWVVDRAIFYIPSIFIFSIWIAEGVAGGSRLSARYSQISGTAFGVVAALAPGLLLHNFDALDQSDFYAVHDETMAAFGAASEDAILLMALGFMEDDAVLYASLVEDVRPDVEVIDYALNQYGQYEPELDRLRTAHISIEEVFRRSVAVQLRDVDPEREIFLLPGRKDYDWKSIGFTRVTLGVIDQLARRTPDLCSTAIPTFAANLEIDKGPTFRGLSVAVPTILQGDVLELQLYWELGERCRGAIHLYRAGGSPRRLSTRRPGSSTRAQSPSPGTGRPTRRLCAGDHDPRAHPLLAIPYSLPAGDWRIWLGVERDGKLQRFENGLELIAAASVRVEARERDLWRLPVVSRPAGTLGDDQNR